MSEFRPPVQNLRNHESTWIWEDEVEEGLSDNCGRFSPMQKLAIVDQFTGCGGAAVETSAEAMVVTTGYIGKVNQLEGVVKLQ